MTGISWRQQTRDNPPGFNTVTVNLNPLRLIPDVVGTLAFGKYSAPDYRGANRLYPPLSTRTGVPEVQGVNEIYFNLILPSGPRPTDGWPVVIYGHGANGNKNQANAVNVSTVSNWKCRP